MKNSILIAALITVCTVSFAQTDSMRNRTDSTRNRVGNNNSNADNRSKYDNHNQYNADRKYQKSDSANYDCAITMTNGKLMKVTAGKTTAMDKEMVMRNGTVVGIDGTVRTKDGEIIKMNEGDCLDRSGKKVAKNDWMKENRKNDIKQ